MNSLAQKNRTVGIRAALFGLAMTAEEMLAELRAVDVAAARAAGQAMLDGPRAVASIGGKLALAA